MLVGRIVCEGCLGMRGMGRKAVDKSYGRVEKVFG